MKLLSSLLFALCLMVSAQVSAEPMKSGCQCRECRCTPQNHCGCYSDEGCHCANPKCQCGPNCKCGPNCQCGNGQRGSDCKCGPNCQCVKRNSGNNQSGDEQRGSNFDQYGNQKPVPSASRTIGGRN